MGAAASFDTSNVDNTPITSFPDGSLPQLLDVLGRIDASMYDQVNQALSNHPAALATLQGLGYSKESKDGKDSKASEQRVPTRAEQQQPVHVEAKLPPELEQFIILKEMPPVAAALNDDTFVAAQKAVQDAPNEASALATLQKIVQPVANIYRAAIDARVQEKGIKATCRTVIEVGNGDFEAVYENVWNLTSKSDKDGVDKYAQALKAMVVPEKSPRQKTNDICILFQHAAQVKDKYAAFVKSLVESMNVELSIPTDLKKMGRIIEKTLLKRKDDPGNANKVCDLVRGMVTCDNIGQIAAIVGFLGLSPEIVVTRIKDRFLTCPSGGGWRDCMVNFYLKADVNQHICEIQLVHRQMMTARKGLPGHAVYNRVRNADEIVNQWIGVEQPQTRSELQRWLVEWQKGDKFARGPPNSWDVRMVTNMSGLFSAQENSELREFNDPIEDWDVRNVKTMANMFYEAASFNQPIGKWNTENVTDMAKMFERATSFNQPIGQWNTGKVGNMNYMFRRATSFTQDISQWNLGNVPPQKMRMMYNEKCPLEYKHDFQAKK